MNQGNTVTNIIVDIPFDKRRHCWFCGEPFKHYFSFPHQQYLVLDCPHPPLQVPSCSECSALAIKVKKDSIWAVESIVKRQLIAHYQKDLAIGINWTKEELANSEFEGGNFEGFKKSAWFVYEVAKARVNYRGWPLALNGITLDIDFLKIDFSFDGVVYPCIDDAIDQYVSIYNLNKLFFLEVLQYYGGKRFAAAVRYCRLFVNATPKERASALRELSDN